MLIATVATLVTDPITFPPIYFAAYQTDHSMLNGRIADLNDAGLLHRFAGMAAAGYPAVARQVCKAGSYGQLTNSIQSELASAELETFAALEY